MGNTFNAFIAFISEDPIMLGLCIAILVLIIMFILILVIGKKRDNKEEIADKSDNNELLKTEINMDALRSTHEYKIEELNPDLPTLEPKEEPTKASDTKEIPVTTEEPTKVEINDENNDTIVLEPTIDNEEAKNETVNTETQNELSVKSFDDIKITENNDIESLNIDDSQENASFIESNILPVEDTKVDVEPTPITIDESIIEENKPEIIESEENPVIEEQPEQQPIYNADDFFGVKVTPEDETSKPTSIETEIPVINEAEPKEDTPNETGELEITLPEEDKLSENTNVLETNEPTVEEEQTINDTPPELPDYSDVYTVEDIELPNINFDELTNNQFSSFKNIEELPKANEEEDDLDLPKLNTNTSSSINSLKGESFKIN